MKLLDVDGLSKSFGGVAALRQVQGHSVVGETLGMIGPNGSGKTTFVNIVSGHVRPDAGTLTFGGIDISGKTPHELASIGLCRTYQSVRVFASLSTRQNIDNARLLLNHRGLNQAELSELLEWLQLDALLDKSAGSLTLFEQRRLELLMRLVLKPQLIMLDEPVGGLAVMVHFWPVTASASKSNQVKLWVSSAPMERAKALWSGPSRGWCRRRLGRCASWASRPWMCRCTI